MAFLHVFQVIKVFIAHESSSVLSKCIASVKDEGGTQTKARGENQKKKFGSGEGQDMETRDRENTRTRTLSHPLIGFDLMRNPNPDKSVG